MSNDFLVSCRLWVNVEKYCTAGQTTDDNVAHAILHAVYRSLQTKLQNM
jgi:hypothetical protein